MGTNNTFTQQYQTVVSSQPFPSILQLSLQNARFQLLGLEQLPSTIPRVGPVPLPRAAEAPRGTPRCGDSTGDKVPAPRTTVPRRYHRPRLDQHLPKQPSSSAAASSPHGSRRRASGAAQGRRRGAAGAAGSSSLRRGAPHRPPPPGCVLPHGGGHTLPPAPR